MNPDDIKDALLFRSGSEAVAILGSLSTSNPVYTPHHRAAWPLQCGGA
jgi:hypothetical protein